MVKPHPTQPENFVSIILGGEVRISNVTKDLERILVKLDGKQDSVNGQSVWIIEFDSEQQLAEVLLSLNAEGVIFAGGPAGWPPSQIIADLRDQGLFKGKYKEVVWIKKNEWRFQIH